MIAPLTDMSKALLKTIWFPSLAADGARGGISPAAVSSRRCDIFVHGNHRFVRAIIIRPHFGQPRAKLDCEMLCRCLKARSGLYSGFLSPPAPRDADGPGQSFPECLCTKAGAPPAFLIVAGDCAGQNEGEEPRALCRRGLNHWPSMADVCGVSGAKPAPRMRPGFSRVPCCTKTAAVSLSSATISEIGTLHVKSVPLKSPSLSQ
jgi:hypothetical protein